MPLENTLPPTPGAQDQLKDAALDPAVKKKHKRFRQNIDTCKQYKRKLIQQWSINVDYRRGKPYASQTDEDRIAVNLDWSLTKQKQASLFSQIPAVRVNHPPQTVSKEVAPWLHSFEQRINDSLLTAGIETAMDECLPDCINAAGIGVVTVSHEALTEMVEVPAVDLATIPPEIQAQILQSGMMPDGTPIPMETVPKVLDHRYVVSRISPSDFLWPVAFAGSDFDNAPWIGRTGRITWAEAQERWDLPDEERQKYVSNDRPLINLDAISTDSDKEVESGDEYVTFDEIFYKEFQYGKAQLYAAIHHIVFLTGRDTPVTDEPWKGQQTIEDALIGAYRYPIRVLTLSYITDDAIPPSDTAIGRPQVDEINKSRTQMILQRERSIPIRWFDVNRIDPAIQYSLMRGTWQGMIPVQGIGTNVIGEINHSGMPQENFAFYTIAKNDLDELWMVGQEPSGNDVETKGEAQVIQTNAQTRISRERAKVGKFFCSIAEVLGGLICIYEDPASFGEGFDPKVSKTLNYSILADSTVLLDSNQRLKRLMDFINFTAKSGQVNIEPVLREIATLSGLDPAVVIVPPEPKPPTEPNMSLRLTGVEDLLNPMALAFLIKSGQAPSTKEIEEAKQLISISVQPPPAPQLGPDGMPPPQPPVEMPPPGDLPIGQANPNWGAMPRINKRAVDHGEEF